MPAAPIVPDFPLHSLPRDSSIHNNTLPPYRRLEGKVAIITGGAGGIGEATARLFVCHGAKVIIADINNGAGLTLAESLSPSATYIHCDVSLENDVAHLVGATLAQHGRLDILVNHAGVLGSQTKAKKSILNFDPDEFDRIMRVNVKGTALCIKHAARAMLGRAGAGCIVSTASVAGVMGGMGPHSYTASKHAIVGLTKNAACELGGYGIRVNCISPFGVATPMLVNAWRSSGMDGNFDGGDGAEMEEVTAEKMEEFVREMATLKGVTLKPKDIAEAALYLAGDESKYVNGHNLVVDGGFTTTNNVLGF